MPQPVRAVQLICFVLAVSEMNSTEVVMPTSKDCCASKAAGTERSAEG